MNKVFMVGRLAGDPQQFVTKNGITQSRLTIASSDNWNKNETYFFPCVAWQSQANFINTYLKKGDLVAVDGKLIRRSYVNNEGKNQYVMEIVVESIKPLSSSKPSSMNVEFESSIDENFKANNNVAKYQNQNFNQTAYENSTDAEVDQILEKMENKETESDIFDLDNPTSQNDNDEIVNLDWLKDFSN